MGQTYVGARSFLRMKYTKDLAVMDIAITGVPYDLAVTNRTGTRFGPRAIRAASTKLAWDGGNYPWGFDPLMRLAIGVVKPDPAMCDSHHDVATMAADAKHHAKMNPPEYLFFCRRNSPRCVVEVGEGDGPDEPLHLYKV